MTSSPNLVGLTASGETMLVAEVHPDRVHRYGLDGVLIETVELLGEPLLVTGLDTDGFRLYVATHTTGDVHVFGFDGTETGRIPIGLVADLSGVTVDPAANELWVATGTGMNDIRRFDLGGNPLGVFPAGADGIMGLYVIGNQVFADAFETGDHQAWQ